jgi:diguanylate cyclase (GGDEF)-like protein
MRIAELERTLAERSTYDELTGLLTAARFHTRLESELRRVERYPRPLSLGLLDVDGFRALNASHGRTAGDRALAAIGRAISAGIRNVDVAARIAADEFAVLMPETKLSAAITCLERVLSAVEGEVDEGRSIGVSVGIVACNSGQSADVLFGAAAECLERARHAGGGRIVTGEHAADGRIVTGEHAADGRNVTGEHAADGRIVTGEDAADGRIAVGEDAADGRIVTSEHAADGRIVTGEDAADVEVV